MEGLEGLKGKTVLVTGHTGFCGTWLCIYLVKLGANVVGYSLDRYDNDILFHSLKLGDKIEDMRGDVRDYNYFRSIVKRYEPSLIFHLAAQPLVRKSYDDPIETYTTNILGTINVLELMKEFMFIKAAVIVTTDKVYKESNKKHKESDVLGGHDPYSTSKACVEMIVESYRNSFYSLYSNKLIATARAGNIIGSGDYSVDRLIPDCIKAISNENIINIRNPNSVRPWQHVTDVMRGYLILGCRLLEGNKSFASSWNFAPNKKSLVPVSKVVDLFIHHWGNFYWTSLEKADSSKHESKILLLDNSKAKRLLKWQPHYNLDESIKLTVEGYKDINMIEKQVEVDLAWKN
jgi:CDP-glucose 4,6-dehydratase